MNCACVQICILAVTGILKQQKRTKKKVEFDPYELTGSPRPIDSSDLRPGDRSDNECLLYQRALLPRNEEEWNKFTFVEKTHWGYYTWPKSVQIQLLCMYLLPDIDLGPSVHLGPDRICHFHRGFVMSIAKKTYIKNQNR